MVGNISAFLVLKLVRDNMTADERNSADVRNSKLIYKNLRAFNISYSLFSETLFIDNL